MEKHARWEEYLTVDLQKNKFNSDVPDLRGLGSLIKNDYLFLESQCLSAIERMQKINQKYLLEVIEEAWCL